MEMDRIDDLSKYQTLVFLTKGKERIDNSIDTISKVCCDIKMDIKKGKENSLEKDYGRLICEVLYLGSNIGLDAEASFCKYMNM